VVIKASNVRLYWILPKFRWTAGFMIALFALVACNHQEGIVEINWAFVDQDGDKIIPSRDAENSCGFAGNLAGKAENYQMQVELRVCEPGCEGGCENPACYAVDPFRFDCHALRASSKLPASFDGYEFQVAVIAVPDNNAQEQCECELRSPCIERPGPRIRTIEAGLITDLQVYQLVLALPTVEPIISADERIVFDVQECCQLPSSCASSSVNSTSMRSTHS